MKWVAAVSSSPATPKKSKKKKEPNFRRLKIKPIEKIRIQEWKSMAGIFVAWIRFV